MTILLDTKTFDAFYAPAGGAGLDPADETLTMDTSITAARAATLEKLRLDLEWDQITSFGGANNVTLQQLNYGAQITLSVGADLLYTRFISFDPASAFFVANPFSETLETMRRTHVGEQVAVLLSHIAHIPGPVPGGVSYRRRLMLSLFGSR